MMRSALFVSEYTTTFRATLHSNQQLPTLLAQQLPLLPTQPGHVHS
jgi:hypothetical protein